MVRTLSFRQLLLSILALWYDLSQKEVGARAGIPQKQVSHYLRRERLVEIKDEVFERLLGAVGCPPAAVRIVTACLEGLEALEQDGDLTAEEKGEIEGAALTTARMTRATVTEAVRLSRAPAMDHPSLGDASLSRQRAETLGSRLKDLPQDLRLALVQSTEEFQSWALCEWLCAESAREASRHWKRSAGLARLAREVAQRVSGPESWRNRLRGYSAAHGANSLRVSGELNAAEAAFEEAKRLWHSGSDPAPLLDPGRLLDLEASLRRDQRRFAEALTLLDEAAAIGASPARILINKAFTLEVMGDYERAVETLLQAQPLVESQGDPGLLYMMRFNLAVNSCHLGLYVEAAGLVRQVREAAMERSEENELTRVLWLEGRIAAGLGRTSEARGLLEQARREFGRRDMVADAALTLLEEATLLLRDGQTAEVKVLGRELAGVLESKGVHREALAALRLFQEAAERETATIQLARRVLSYLYRARYDQGLWFTL